MTSRTGEPAGVRGCGRTGFRLRAWGLGAALCAVLLAAGPPMKAQAPAHRVISLVPAVTEMLFAIGAGPDVVGVSSFDKYPAEVRSRPRVGALVDPDFERILTLHPDLVVVYGSQIDLITRLTRSGIATFTYRHAGLPDITSTIEAIGIRVGRADRARAVAAGIEHDLARVRGSVAGQASPATALIFSREAGALRGMYASGGIGFLHDLLVLAGGRDVFGDVKREGLQVSAEVMLVRAPEVVIEIRESEGWTPERIARETRIWQQLPSLPAVRSGRVYILADDKFSVPGPRVAEIARAMAEVLHPGAAQGR
jgi:iron complex transport system substrate-binding protein